jgi:hypothetical protein
VPGVGCQGDGPTNVIGSVCRPRPQRPAPSSSPSPSLNRPLCSYTDTQLPATWINCNLSSSADPWSARHPLPAASTNAQITPVSVSRSTTPGPCQTVSTDVVSDKALILNHHIVSPVSQPIHSKSPRWPLGLRSVNIAAAVLCWSVHLDLTSLIFLLSVCKALSSRAPVMLEECASLCTHLITQG